MGVYERMAGQQEPKIPVHQFVAACAEVARNKINAITAAGYFNLSAAERQEANTLIGLVQGGTLNRPEVHDALLLMEYGLRTVAETKTRLGV